MLVNDIKKGMTISMTHGRVGTMLDNKKGNIRMVEVTNSVNGPEMGSVYAKDILMVRILESATGTEPMDGVWVDVELSPAQRKAAGLISASGF
jgi:hypothetical protein